MSIRFLQSAEKGIWLKNPLSLAKIAVTAELVLNHFQHESLAGVSEEPVR
jgi:hypothetical protein